MTFNNYKLSTQIILEGYDSDASSVCVSTTKYYLKSIQKKKYESPYGSIEIKRHTYQNSGGGKQYVPLEVKAGLVESSTLRFAKMLSWKYAQMPSARVEDDLSANHLRAVSSSYIQKISYAVGDLLLSKEVDTTYTLPDAVPTATAATLSVGRDGAMMRIKGDGYREAMAGTLSVVNANRDVLHTIYVADSPEKGKEGFDILLENEMIALRKSFPTLDMAGLADGSDGNWRFLAPKVDVQIIDWWHAQQYIIAAMREAYPTHSKAQKEVEKWGKRLKTEPKVVGKLLASLQRHYRKLIKNQQETGSLKAAITYLKRHKHQMNYAQYIKDGYLIGSGVTESACKTMIKNRFCGCGMQWTISNAQVLLLIRGLTITEDRWEQAWSKLTKSNV